IKVLPPELAFQEGIRTRFLREAETAARLSHPNIVPIHAVGEGPDGIVYFVMAYVDGEPLSARLKRRGRLPPEEVRRILSETADALSAAHALGIIHRDVKPDNILREGSRGRVVVTDFGIAKALSSATGGTLTATGVAIGTPHFMSPEQAAGDREIDGRSDIYSLGVVGYQMLVGELPFRAPTVPGMLMKHIAEPAPMIMEKRADCPEDHPFVTWASVFSGVAVLDVVNAGRLSWAGIGVAIWGAFGVLPRFWKLWEAGYSWRDILHRPVAPDGAEARLGTSAGRAGRLAPPTADEFGRHLDAINQVRLDRQ